MKNLLPFILGIMFGIVFQHDIPIIKDIDDQGIRNHILAIFGSLQGGEEWPKDYYTVAVGTQIAGAIKTSHGHMAGKCFYL